MGAHVMGEDGHTPHDPRRAPIRVVLVFNRDATFTVELPSKDERDSLSLHGFRSESVSSSVVVGRA